MGRWFCDVGRVEVEFLLKSLDSVLQVREVRIRVIMEVK